MTGVTQLERRYAIIQINDEDICENDGQMNA
jgi:hypothetical protein